MSEFFTSFLQKETFFHNGREEILQRTLNNAFTIYAKDKQLISCIIGSNYQFRNYESCIFMIILTNRIVFVEKDLHKIEVLKLVVGSGEQDKK